MIARRPVLAGLALALLGSAAKGMPMEESILYGLIGKLKARPGMRAALIEILMSGSGGMPGCLVYTIAEDIKDPDGIWITEVWKDKASHDASLSLPGVKIAIGKGRSMILAFESSVETRPLSLGIGHEN